MRLKRLSTVGQLPRCLMIPVIFNPLRQIIFFFCGMVHSFHQERLQAMKSTHAEDGVKFNIWRTPFWRRWTREYLPQLQQRQKWFHEKRNLAVGDIVLIVDDRCPRSSWPLGRIVETHTNLQDGCVRSAKVKTTSTTLSRPITKLVLLETVESTNS